MPRKSVQCGEVLVERKVSFLDKWQAIVHHGLLDALSRGFSPQKPGRVGKLCCLQLPTEEWEQLSSHLELALDKMRWPLIDQCSLRPHQSLAALYSGS